MELYAANRQWAVRPPDQRFWTPQQMFEVCHAYAVASREVEVPWNALELHPGPAEDTAENLYMGLPGGLEAQVTHFTFRKLCERVQAHQEYLVRLPAELAARCVNHGLARNRSEGAQAKLLVHRNGGLVVRATTTTKYTRIWNWDLAQWLTHLLEFGWRVPPARPAFPDQPGTRPATEEDVLDIAGGGGLSVNVGDPIAPAGLYASDSDCFAFMINTENRLDDGTPEGLSRGFFVSNSEVGNGAFNVTWFLFRHCCGNHIVWGAQGINKVSLRHVGIADVKARGELEKAVGDYLGLGAGLTEANIRRAKEFAIAPNKNEVVRKVYYYLGTTVSQAALGSAYDLCARHHEQDGDPNTAWGLSNGMTRYSQRMAYAGARTALDAGAGKVLQLASA